MPITISQYIFEKISIISIGISTLTYFLAVKTYNYNILDKHYPIFKDFNEKFSQIHNDKTNSVNTIISNSKIISENEFLLRQVCIIFSSPDKADRILNAMEMTIKFNNRKTSLEKRDYYKFILYKDNIRKLIERINELQKSINNIEYTSSVQKILDETQLRRFNEIKDNWPLFYAYTREYESIEINLKKNAKIFYKEFCNLKFLMDMKISCGANLLRRMKYYASHRLK